METPTTTTTSDGSSSSNSTENDDVQEQRGGSIDVDDDGEDVRQLDGGGPPPASAGRRNNEGVDEDEDNEEDDNILDNDWTTNGAKDFIIDILDREKPQDKYKIKIPVPPPAVVVVGNPPDDEDDGIDWSQFDDNINGKNNEEHERGWDLLTCQLQEDRDVSMVAFIQEHILFDELPFKYQTDKGFLRHAVQSNSRLYFRLPTELQSDTTFLIDGVIVEEEEEEEGTSYAYNDDVIMVNDDMIYAVFEKNPTLRDDAKFWKNNIICTSMFGDRNTNMPSSLLHPNHNANIGSTRTSTEAQYCSLKYAPPSILSNHELMIKACSVSPRELLTLTNHENGYLSDISFLEQVLKEQPLGLLFVPVYTLKKHPHLLLDNIGKFLSRSNTTIGITYDNDNDGKTTMKPFWTFNDKNGYMEYIVDRLCWNRTTFFTDDYLEEFAINKWFSNGGLFYDNERFPKSWRDNPKCYLAMAKHVHSMYKEGTKERSRVYGQEQFDQYLPEKLRNDDNFMLQVSEYVNWPLLHCHYGYEEVVVQSSNSNIEIIIRCLANSSEEEVKQYKLKYTSIEWENHTKHLLDYVINEKLLKFFNFRTLILSQLSSSNNDKCSFVTSDTLSLLNQGYETTLMFKKLIAQYVGIPLGKELMLYCKAYEMMKKGFRWRYVRPPPPTVDDEEGGHDDDDATNNEN